MVFSSNIFVFYFLPMVLLVYYSLPSRARHFALTVLSYVFYGWANPAFMILMFLSTVNDYAAGLVMTGQNPFRSRSPIERLDPSARRTGRQRAALIASITVNLGLLGFFKYFNFATENYNGLMDYFGLTGMRLDHIMRVVLPLGISFYTFQTMSYAIDVYRGQAAALRNFIDFACFVSMFPQLVAGPIIRYSEVADQLRSRSHTIEKFARGVAFFSLGMAKKILLANPCGKVADTVFGAGAAGVLDSWYGLFAYAFQIYFDFSGYSDMAIGLGLMFGFVFPKNFDSPYTADSITDFWRRWHMSLSTWLRDYLFFPLSRAIARRIEGNRVLFLRADVFVYASGTLTTMLLAGLWHGAAWNFVVWGGMHGCLLAAERVFIRRSAIRLPRFVRVAATFGVVLLSWVVFRADSMASAMRYFSALMGRPAASPSAPLLDGLILNPYYLITFAVAALVTWTCPQAWDWTRKLTWPKAACCAVLLLVSVAVMSSQAYNPFIYFIF